MSVESRGGRAQGGRDAAIAELTGLLGPAVGAAGFDLEEVDVRPAGRRRLVKVVVDGDDGVALDDIARISEAVSRLLDESDVMGTSPYVLEVTSPGVDRPLTEPRHWRRAVGRLVVAPLAEGGQIEGRVVAADDRAVEIDVVQNRRTKGAGAKGAGQKGAGTVRRRFGLGELGRGRVQVEFKPLDRTAEEKRSPAEPD
ncbi:ribosome maturation factor RimP [Actinomadura sp. BRA 177]|uniref:ribosome maturation factor RimP n=1 Tax=Actinomadura sp. BRA 177 TaxID=2745202 RepID=UPI0015952482|nr:ribosome maturation factor RimP [Actinomadura sp. BRA 177]NVI86282.1 ribosome maturation factor RimP [Actinomadura sp. BRA 177]